jgi:AraC-like DNA-binding protein
MQPWTAASTLNGLAALCCDEPHIRLLSDPDSLALTQRGGGIGALAIAELVVGSEVSLDVGEQCSGYRLNMLRSGRVQSFHRRSSITACAGSIVMHPPQGHASARWAADSRMVAVKIDRDPVDNALSELLGRQVSAEIDFQSIMPATAAAATWINMLVTLAEQSFEPGSMLTRPLVSAPYVDSLVRGLLLVTDHPHRDAVAAEPKTVAPHTVRVALDIIEAEAHLPLTATTLATRCHVSVRSLQDGFRRHLDTSPMTYLREVRLRRAHLTLRQSDSSVTTVASVAYQWGFNNLGRFAAAHTARYGEPPATTLRRRQPK